MARNKQSISNVFSEWYIKTQGPKATSTRARIQTIWDYNKWQEFNNVPILTLIEDPYYFGWRGKHLFDCHKEDILTLFDLMTSKTAGGKGLDIRVFVDEEGTRSGKTWKASIIFAILLFKNIIIHDLNQFYPAIATDSGLGFLATSREATTTREVIFKELLLVFLNSPFFTDYFPPQVTLEQIETFSRNPGVLRFPNHIAFQAGSAFQNDLQGLGYTIIAALLDEVNFYPKIRDSKRQAAALSSDGTLDSARLAYDTIYSRIDNQFNYKGFWPQYSLLEIFSSAGYVGDLTETLRKQAQQGDEEIFCVTRSTIDARPHTYSGEFFEFDLDSLLPCDGVQDVTVRYEKYFGKKYTTALEATNEEDLA